MRTKRRQRYRTKRKKPTDLWKTVGGHHHSPGLGFTHTIDDERRMELNFLDEKIKRLEKLVKLQAIDEVKLDG